MAWERRSATYATYNLILPNDVALKAALRLETETNIYLPEHKYAAVSYTFNRLNTYHPIISATEREKIIYQMRCITVLALLITNTKEHYRKQSKKNVDRENDN